MPAPNTYFNYNPNGLSVTFKDLSSGNPTSWLWDFGDGETSADQNPSHSYAQSGYYDVSLIATNATGPTELILTVGIAGSGVAMPINLFDLIDTYVPSGVTLDPNNKNALMKKWQIYFQPLVSPIVSALNVFNELAYDPLANSLIARLVALDLIDQAASQFLTDMGSEEGSSGQEKKQIVTGPAEAQWYSNSDLWKGIMKQGGTYTMMQQQACTLAARIRVQLDFCKALKHNTVVPSFCTPIRVTSVNANPFGIKHPLD